MGSMSKNGGGIVVEEGAAAAAAAAEEVQQQMVLEQQIGGVGAVGNGGLYVKVMTDEQMELLRRQISVYATICEQLVEMHKAMSAHQDSLAGMRMGNMYCDPLMASTGHKITARQRWTPSQMQLQILESIFEQGTGTPSKQKIKDITSELSEHGPISETNVYNWFQNRRARSKRKQQVATSNNGESEVETEADSPKEKKTKSENIHSNDNAAFYADDLGFQSQEVNSNTCNFDLDIGKMHRGFQGNDGFRPSESLANISFFDTNPRLDHFMGNLDIPAGFNTFRTTEGFDMIG